MTLFRAYHMMMDSRQRQFFCYETGSWFQYDICVLISYKLNLKHNFYFIVARFSWFREIPFFKNTFEISSANE